MGPWGRFVEHVASKLAFFPPQPPTYEVREHPDGAHELYIQPTTPEVLKVLGCQVLRLHTGGAADASVGGAACATCRVRPPPAGNEIVAALVPYRRDTRRTLLFSHGNAVDLGRMLPFFRELAKELRCNVMGYDYSGYGGSTGSPSVAATLADIRACYNWLLGPGGRAPADIILYGQSVGSGPSVALAAQEPKLAGLVLHSPLLSGVRVLYPNWKRWPAWADVYPNQRLMPAAHCPVLVMHGTADEVIHVSHGRALAALARRPAEPLWAEGYSHQDLELCPDYLPRLRAFVDSCCPP